MSLLLVPSPPAAEDVLDAESQARADIAVALRAAADLHERGDADQARAIYELILANHPAHADTHYNAAVLHRQSGNHETALTHLETALGIEPNHTFYWVAYLHTLIDAGHISAAWAALNLYQQRSPEPFSVQMIITRLTHSAEGKPAELAFHAPQAPVAANPAGQATQPKRGAAAKAGEPGQKELRPLIESFNGRRYDAARQHAERLLKRYPECGAVWQLYGRTLRLLGECPAAIEALQTARRHQPGEVSLRRILGELLYYSGDAAQAVDVCREIVALNERCSDGHRLLALSLEALGKLDEAMPHFHRAIELEPRSAAASNALGVTLLNQGRVAEAAPFLRQAHENDPRDAAVHSNLLFCLAHVIEITPAELFAEHRRFSALHEAPLRGHAVPLQVTADPDRRLNIGFVSGDLYKHAVTTYLLPIVAQLAQDTSLALHFYSNSIRDDNTTAALRRHAAQWRVVVAMSDEQLARQIAEDRIDILIDLSGHTGYNRLMAFARKPAPIQMSWIGSPCTTGLDAIDYYLADRHALPFGEMEAQYSEKIIHLPALAPFVPNDQAPPVNLLPASHRGHLTFASFNRPSKLRPDVIALWARVLERLPDARLIIGGSSADSERTMRDWVAQAGIDSERVSFLQRTGVSYFLQQHHQVDVCLDTFPYSASTTTLNSLWMGVPTLTIAGATLPSRGSTTWLSHVGLDEFVAHDADDFVEKAVALAGKLPALEQWRADLRDRCRASAAFQPDTVAIGLSSALRTAWRRWCQGLPAEAFEVPATNPNLNPSHRLIAGELA